MMQIAVLLAAIGHASPGSDRPLALVLVPPTEEQIPFASETLLHDLLQQLGVRSMIRHLPESTATLAEQIDATRGFVHQTGAAVAFVVPLPMPTRVLVYMPAEGSSGREGRLLVRDVAAAQNPASALEAVATILRGTVLALLEGARIELPDAEAGVQGQPPRKTGRQVAREIRIAALGTVAWLGRRAWPGASVAVALSRPTAAVPWEVELAGAWQPANALNRAQTSVDVERWSLTMSAMLHTSLGPARLGGGAFGRIEWIQLRVDSQPAWAARAHDASDRFLSGGPACRLAWPKDTRWRISIDARLGWQAAARRYRVATPDSTEVLLDTGHVYVDLGLGLSVVFW